MPSRFGVVLKVLNFGALGFEFLRRVEGDVGLVGSQQLVHIFLIYFASFALAIGTFVAAKAHALVEFYAEPTETFQDIFFGPRHKSIAVGVFNAKNEFAAVLTREQIVVERRAHAANVERAGGTGRKTHPHFSFCHFVLYIGVFLCAKIGKVARTTKENALSQPKTPPFCSFPPPFGQSTTNFFYLRTENICHLSPFTFHLKRCVPQRPTFPS